jgi:hypothetical protein
VVYIFLFGVIRILDPEFTGFFIYGIDLIILRLTASSLKNRKLVTVKVKDRYTKELETLNFIL